MAIGDQTDIAARYKSVLPDWFPLSVAGQKSSTPMLDWMASGIGSLFAWLYALIQYAKQQTRIGSATDGWLDLISQDLFGGALPRLPGETDLAFRTRINANLFLPANTKTAIINALQALTGQPVRNIEPFDPRDTFVWGKSFWGVNTKLNPGQWANGNQRNAFLIRCSAPAVTGGGGMPRFGWGNFFWGSGPTNAVALGSWWTAFSAASATSLVYALLNKLRAVGISVYVQFDSPSSI